MAMCTVRSPPTAEHVIYTISDVTSHAANGDGPFSIGLGGVGGIFVHRFKYCTASSKQQQPAGNIKCQHCAAAVQHNISQGLNARTLKEREEIIPVIWTVFGWQKADPLGAHSGINR